MFYHYDNWELLFLICCFNILQDPNAASTPSKGKKGKKDKGKKDDAEKENASSPDGNNKSAQEQMAQMRETGKVMDLPKVC